MAVENVQDRYLSGHTVLNCGQETATEIDKEVMQILKTAYDQAIVLLEENRECLDKIAEFLIEKETITGKEFMKIFREVKGIPEPEEEIKATEVPEEENLSEAPADEEWTDCLVKKANGAETIASRQSTEDK